MPKGFLPMPFWNWTTYDGHGGLDWGQRGGTPIRAIAAGRVTYLDWWGRDIFWNGRWTRGGGITRTITAQTPRGLIQIIHCHLESFEGPRLGDSVRLGDFIGPVGNTGWSTGNHLHVEIWKDGVPQREWDWLDPENWMGKNGSIASLGGDTVPHQPLDLSMEKDMILIAQRKEAGLAKGRYNPETGRIREITKSENELLRGAQAAGAGANVVYSTVSNEAYGKLLTGAK